MSYLSEYQLLLRLFSNYNVFKYDNKLVVIHDEFFNNLKYKMMITRLENIKPRINKPLLDRDHVVYFPGFKA